MRLYYRISDHAYTKPKLPGANKKSCLFNFIAAFKDLIFSDDVIVKGDKPPLTIIGDKIDNALTLELLQDTGMPLIRTELGNAGSLFFTLQQAIDECDDQEIVYFCEDDYLHRLLKTELILEEGFQFSDYVTLYDHPDKYTNIYDFGEVSKVVKGVQSHWRYTQSTCMTFGVRISTLKADLEIWKKHTSGDHPHDHHIFTDLKAIGRKLVVPIPGVACHTDLTFSGQAKQVLIDNWAIELMIEEIENKLDSSLEDLKSSVIKPDMNSWEKLKMLDAISQMIKNRPS